MGEDVVEGEVGEFDLASMIKEAVAEAMDSLHSKYDITPKPKPVRKAKKEG